MLNKVLEFILQLFLITVVIAFVYGVMIITPRTLVTSLTTDIFSGYIITGSMLGYALMNFYNYGKNEIESFFDKREEDLNKKLKTYEFI